MANERNFPPQNGVRTVAFSYTYPNRRMAGGTHVTRITRDLDTITIVLPATIDALPEVLNPICDALEAHGCPHPTVDRIAVAVEELYVNVAHYAYPEYERPGEARVTCAISEDGSRHCVEFSFEDEGIPFDPVAKPDPKLATSVDEVKIGGLGILMVKRMMDSLTYERRGATNVTTTSKCW